MSGKAGKTDNFHVNRNNFKKTTRWRKAVIEDTDTW